MNKQKNKNRRLYESKRIVLRYEALAREQFERLLRKNLKMPVSIFTL